MDFCNPDYPLEFSNRAKLLMKLRKDPKLVITLKSHYGNCPWDFVKDWGMTYEPRNVERGLPAEIPFVPFDRQIEFLQWLTQRWEAGEGGLVEKSRDMGVTWLAVGWSVSMWLFRPGFAAGFGSRKEELVDKKGDTKSIFEKIRPLVRMVPKEFRPEGYNEREHSTYMRLINPENGSTITGESGDNIGRGGRQSAYFVDEAAFVERQGSVDAALSQNTNCQIDISTPNGNGNAFYRKRHSGKVKVFEFDWRDDPRKHKWELVDEETGKVTTGSGRDCPLGAIYPWYEKQKATLDEVIVAQEIDRDYNASAENVFIPAKWVRASIDAHIRLGFEPSGIKVVSFDPADVGDAKARLYRYGSVIMECAEMKKGDIRDALPWVEDYAMSKRNGTGLDTFVYDSDGMGAPVVKLSIQDKFDAKDVPIIHFHGSGEVIDKKDECLDLNKSNGDAFANYRAQSCYGLRRRFERTYEAIEKGVYTDPDTLISISSTCEGVTNLIAELSRPQRKYRGNGKILVESKPEMRSRGVSSPNLFDVANMAFAVDSVKAGRPVRVNFESEWG
tara:strand:+ start:861 stop:2534 length:1674 start_codon:yes stop_codon:yes gene_type:complete